MFTPLSGSVSSDSSRGERHSWQWGGEGEMKPTLLGPVVVSGWMGFFKLNYWCYDMRFTFRQCQSNRDLSDAISSFIV